MELTLHQTGAAATGLEVSEQVFAASYNAALVHQVLTAYMAASRAGSKAQKSRSEVRGGGRKPWRQKGTGRARAGTIRSPLWRGGGVTFAARPRDFTQKVNRKMYRGAMRAILSELVRQERLSCVDEFALSAPRTRLALEKLAALGLSEVLIVTDAVGEELYLATRNLPRVDVMTWTELNPYSLVGFEHVLFTRAALEKVQAQLT